MYRWYIRYMPAPEKRPRIPADVAEAIDSRRGHTSFEEYVANTLRDALEPVYTVEKDPNRPRRFQVVASPEASDDGPAATGLSRVDAEIYAETLCRIVKAMSMLQNVIEDSEAIEEIESPDWGLLLAEVQIASNRLYDIMGHKLGEPLRLIPHGRH